MPTKQTTYKFCVVRFCPNTTINTPDKMFIHVPMSSSKQREIWLKLARRNPKKLSSRSTLYICEDHFDLPNDMENYMQYKMKRTSRMRMKRGCLPSRFHYPDPSDMLIYRIPKRLKCDGNQNESDSDATDAEYRRIFSKSKQDNLQKHLNVPKKDNNYYRDDDETTQDGSICLSELYENLRESETLILSRNADGDGHSDDDTENGSICLSELYETLREHENLSILKDQNDDDDDDVGKKDVLVIQSATDIETQLDENLSISSNELENMLDNLDAVLFGNDNSTQNIIENDRKIPNNIQMDNEKKNIKKAEKNRNQKAISSGIDGKNIMEDFSENETEDINVCLNELEAILLENEKLDENLPENITSKNVDDNKYVMENKNLSSIQIGNRNSDPIAKQNQNVERNNIQSGGQKIITNKTLNEVTIATENLQSTKNVLEKNRLENQNQKDCSGVNNLYENENSFASKSNVNPVQNHSINDNNNNDNNNTQKNDEYDESTSESDDTQDGGSICPSELYENLWENRNQNGTVSVIQYGKGNRNITVIQNENPNENRKVIVIKSEKRVPSVNNVDQNDSHDVIVIDSDDDDVDIGTQDGSIWENQLYNNLQENENKNQKINAVATANATQNGNTSISPSEFYDNQRENETGHPSVIRQSVIQKEEGKRNVILIKTCNLNENLANNEYIEDGRMYLNQLHENAMGNERQNGKEDINQNLNIGKKIPVTENANNDQPLMENTVDLDIRNRNICPNESYENQNDYDRNQKVIVIDMEDDDDRRIMESADENDTQDGSICPSEFYENLLENENSNQNTNVITLHSSENYNNGNHSLSKVIVVAGTNRNVNQNVIVIENDDDDATVIQDEGSISESEIYENLRKDGNAFQNEINSGYKIAMEITNPNHNIVENIDDISCICPSQLFEDLQELRENETPNPSQNENDNDMQNASIRISEFEGNEANLSPLGHEVNKQNVTDNGKTIIFVTETEAESQANVLNNDGENTQDGSICYSELYENLTEEHENANRKTSQKIVRIQTEDENDNDDETQDGSICSSELYENLREIYNRSIALENEDLDTQDGSICLSELDENIREHENLNMYRDKNDNVMENKNQKLPKKRDIIGECLEGLFDDNDSWLSSDPNLVHKQPDLNEALNQPIMFLDGNVQIEINDNALAEDLNQGQLVNIDSQLYCGTDPNFNPKDEFKKPRRKFGMPQKKSDPKNNKDTESNPGQIKRARKPRMLITCDGVPLKRRYKKSVDTLKNNDPDVNATCKIRRRKALVMINGEPRKRRYKKKRSVRKNNEQGTKQQRKKTRPPTDENGELRRLRRKPKSKKKKRILYITGKIGEVTDSADSDYSCYSCVACGYKTGAQKRLDRHNKWHIKTQANAKEAKCTKCSRKFAAFRCLRRHVNALRQKKLCILQCDKCPYRTENQLYMEQHIDKHKEANLKKMFVCHSCSFITKYKFNLKMHLKVHGFVNPVETHECKMCDYKTPRFFSLNRHYRTKRHLRAVGLPIEEFYVPEPPRKRRRLPPPSLSPSPTLQTCTESIKK